MTRVDESGDRVTVTFDINVYTPQGIFKAAHDFTDSCFVRVDGDKAKFLKVVLQPKYEDIEMKTLGYEFCNYVLGTMKNQGF
jgi:hypothetical protein